MWSRRASAPHSHLVAEGPRATVTARELISLHGRLQGGAKEDNLDANQTQVLVLTPYPHLSAEHPTGQP